MDFEKISSRSNEKVKLFRHLSQSASFRRETGLFALEGARLCSDVAKTGIEIKTAFFTKEALEKYPDYISAVAEKAEQAFEIPPARRRVFFASASSEKRRSWRRSTPRGHI